MGILNYMAIKMLGEKAGFTILGDLNQSINKYGCILNWEDIEPIYSKHNIQFFNIPVSYRTTVQINSLAKKVLQKFKQNKHMPQAFERSGDEPQIIKFKNKQSILQKIAEEIIEKRKNNDLKAIAIIEYDPTKFEETAKYLKTKISDVELIYNHFENFSDSATYLINAKLVKGLEFDTVYIIDPNNNLYAPTLINSKKLFVLLTRAINTLKIYYTNTLSSLLN